MGEKRYDSRGDSENHGLVLAAQSVEDLATWVNFSSFHGKDWELRDIVAGYGCIDLFVEESKGTFAYMGPRLHRERDTNSTFFTWEYQRNGYNSEAMSAGKLMRYTLFWRGCWTAPLTLTTSSSSTASLSTQGSSAKLREGTRSSRTCTGWSSTLLPT